LARTGHGIGVEIDDFSPSSRRAQRRADRDMRQN
jgi:hypothetical protein